MDTLVDKPASIRGYALHRLVEGFTQGKPSLWCDEGTRVRIRPKDAQSPKYEKDSIMGFTLRACVSRSTKNKHKYPHTGDWKTRHEWLYEKARQAGFEVMAIHVSAQMLPVEAHDGRRFTVDSSEFVGVLKVTNPEEFSRALTHGIGKVGKAFGLGLLVVPPPQQVRLVDAAQTEPQASGAASQQNT